MTEGWKTAFKTACRRAGLKGLWFHDLRHTFVTRKVREGWDFRHLMAITGHKIFAVFQRCNNQSEDDIKEVVLASSLSFVYKIQAVTFPHTAHMTGKSAEAVT
jgi:integrase